MLTPKRESHQDQHFLVVGVNPRSCPSPAVRERHCCLNNRYCPKWEVSGGIIRVLEILGKVSAPRPSRREVSVGVVSIREIPMVEHGLRDIVCNRASVAHIVYRGCDTSLVVSHGVAYDDSRRRCA